MSSHYVCGQFETSYSASSLRNWDNKEHLRPASAPALTVSSQAWRTMKAERPTKILVNEYGHLVNRRPNSVSSFNTLPVAGTRGAVDKRWPLTKPNAVVPYAARATFGFKGIPSNTGFSSTVKMPTECFYSTTR